MGNVRYFYDDEFYEAENYFYSIVATYPKYVGFFYHWTNRNFSILLTPPKKENHTVIKIHGRI